MPAKRITSRSEQALQTKTRITETAMDLFSKKGFESVTVDEICEKVGISKGGFYHHFPSKDQILIDQFMEIDTIYRQLEQQLASETSTGQKLYKLSIEALRQIADFGIDFVKVAYGSQLRLDKTVSPLASSRRYVYKIIRSIIMEGQKTGEFRKDIDVAERTRTIISSYRGLIVEWCLKNGKFDLVEAGGDLADSLLRGILDTSSF